MIIKNYNLFNHISPTMSDMERDMLNYIPPGGNWQNLPDKYNSKRLDRIRESGGRTTYYGRLLPNRPSYTITTYFNRLPNGCNIHPYQKRIISIREAARLQSFPDSYKFLASKTAQYKQIGNAVPPLLGRFIAKQLKHQISKHSILDLFSGAGGLSEGFVKEGFEIIAANELVETYFRSYIHNHPKINNPEKAILGDITAPEIKNRIIDSAGSNGVGVVIGGPPCQGFSLAGWRDPNDERNKLFRDYFDIVKVLRPSVFVMENVPGIRTMQKGKVLKEIISSFKSIGYKTLEPFLLKTEEYGVPQKRRRVILIGSLDNKIRFDSSPLFSYDLSHLPDPISVDEAIGSLPSLDINDGVESLTFDYHTKSDYDLLMADKIDFDEFYTRSMERPKQNAEQFRYRLF